jgi:hypothetical protein
LFLPSGLLLWSNGLMEQSCQLPNLTCLR